MDKACNLEIIRDKNKTQKKKGLEEIKTGRRNEKIGRESLLIEKRQRLGKADCKR
jgi:hypothetical protein